MPKRAACLAIGSPFERKSSKCTSRMVSSQHCFSRPVRTKVATASGPSFLCADSIAIQRPSSFIGRGPSKSYGQLLALSGTEHTSWALSFCLKTHMPLRLSGLEELDKKTLDVLIRQFRHNLVSMVVTCIVRRWWW